MTGWRRIYDERRKVILPLVLVLIVNLAVLLLVVLPLSRGVVSAKADSEQAVVDLANAERLERQAKDAAASKARAEQELSRFQTEILPRDFATARRSVSRWVQDAAVEAGLSFNSARFDWEEIRDSRLSRAYSTVTLTGRYPEIRRFLYSLETADDFLVLDKVGLATEVAAGGGAPLVVTLNVSTYYLTPPEP